MPGQPNVNYLTTIAPEPPACDQQGAGPCAAGVTPNGLGSTPNSSGTYPGSSASAAGAGAAGAAGVATPKAASPATSSATGGGTAAAAAVAAKAAAVSAAKVDQNPQFVSTLLPGRSTSSSIAVLVALAFLVVFAVPVVIGYRRSRRRKAAS